jgi:hypothetical protein
MVSYLCKAEVPMCMRVYMYVAYTYTFNNIIVDRVAWLHVHVYV